MNFKSLQLRAQEDEIAALREMRLWRWRDEEEDGDLGFIYRLSLYMTGKTNCMKFLIY